MERALVWNAGNIPGLWVIRPQVGGGEVLEFSLFACRSDMTSPPDKGTYRKWEVNLAVTCMTSSWPRAIGKRAGTAEGALPGVTTYLLGVKYIFVISERVSFSQKLLMGMDPTLHFSSAWGLSAGKANPLAAALGLDRTAESSYSSAQLIWLLPQHPDTAGRAGPVSRICGLRGAIFSELWDNHHIFSISVNI